MEKILDVKAEKTSDLSDRNEIRAEVEEINASGHRQQLNRNFSLLSICSVAITIGNTWTTVGGTIVVALFNGGPPGVIYEFIVVNIIYWVVAASLAELASAMPSSSGGGQKSVFGQFSNVDLSAVYHWASVTAGRHGRICGWFAGWWNLIGYLMGAASISAILGNQIISMYAAFHSGFVIQKWHVFVSYIVCTWISCATVLFANKLLPIVQNCGMSFTVGGVVITILVCAIMPRVNGTPYASNASVWTEWSNETGYASNGFVFLAGMLNGAYAVGTPDAASHMAEEIPQPSKNIPKAIFAQMTIGFLSAFFFLIAILYSINDLSAVIDSGTFPLAEIFRQATGSHGGSLGLLILAFLSTMSCCIGCFIVTGRMIWTLSRDHAIPFSATFAQVSPRFQNPFNATLLCGIACTLLGCLYVGSSTAFNAFAGSFVQLTTLSYLAAILPHLLSKRANVTPGWFWMRGAMGFVVNTISCLYFIVFIVIFCFPYALPVSAASMNYASLITGGLSLFVAVWWLLRPAEYTGPQNISLGNRHLAKDAI